METAQQAAEAVRTPYDAPTGDPEALADLWGGLTVPERRQLLHAAIDVVFLRRTAVAHHSSPIDERVLILWRGEGPSDLPGRGKRPGTLRGFPWPAADN